jgi:predicted phosphate transport protein (TIGR00153 family)
LMGVQEDPLFGFFFKKQRQIEALIDSYLENLRMTQQRFSEALELCLDHTANGTFTFLTEQTHKFESRADDIREEITTLMYSKALLPESREDIMTLLEEVDAIPRIFERVLYMIKMQKLSIPDSIVPDINKLVSISLACFDLMLEQVESLSKRSGNIRALVATIDRNESECDHIERRIITKIFDSDLEPFLKIQLKELISCVGEISDQADRVSKRVNIISMKRRV